MAQMKKTQNSFSSVKFERNLHLLNGMKNKNSTECKIYKTSLHIIFLCALHLGKITSSNYNSVGLKKQL